MAKSNILNELVEAILEKNIAKVGKNIVSLDAIDFEKTFPYHNGLTLLHFVFSCDNSEIIKLFVTRLGTLMQQKELKLETFKNLLKARNDGGSIAIEGIFGKAAASTNILIILKAIQDTEILENVLSSEGLDGNIHSSIKADRVLGDHKKKEIINNAIQGIEHLHNWHSFLKSFLFSPKILLKKRKLSEKYFDKIREDNDEKMVFQEMIDIICINILVSVAEVDARRVTSLDTTSLNVRSQEEEQNQYPAHRLGGEQSTHNIEGESSSSARSPQRLEGQPRQSVTIRLERQLRQHSETTETLLTQQLRTQKDLRDSAQEVAKYHNIRSAKASLNELIRGADLPMSKKKWFEILMDKNLLISSSEIFDILSPLRTRKDLRKAAAEPFTGKKASLNELIREVIKDTDLPMSKKKWFEILIDNIVEQEREQHLCMRYQVAYTAFTVAENLDSIYFTFCFFTEPCNYTKISFNQIGSISFNLILIASGVTMTYYSKSPVPMAVAIRSALPEKSFTAVLVSLVVDEEQKKGYANTYDIYDSIGMTLVQTLVCHTNAAVKHKAICYVSTVALPVINYYYSAVGDLMKLLFDTSIPINKSMKVILFISNACRIFNWYKKLDNDNKQPYCEPRDSFLSDALPMCFVDDDDIILSGVLDNFITD